MHQPGEGGQIGQVEVVGLVQHQVAAHQAQHGGNLAATALAFGGGGEVVDGADQQRGHQQFGGLWVVQHALQHGVGFVVAFKHHMAVFFHQRLGRGGAALLGQALVVLEQRPAGTAAHADGQLVIGQAQQVAEGPPGLQREGAQPHGKGAAHALRGVGQRVHDAGVAQGFAAAGGGQVDDERAVLRAACAQAGGQVGGFVLPAEAFVFGPLFERLALPQAGQVGFKFGQGVGDGGAVAGHAQQVLVQRLVALVGVAAPGHAVVGVGKQGVVGLPRYAPGHGLARGFVQAQAGVVVVGQHQAQAGDVHHIRVAQPVTQPVAFVRLAAQGQQALGEFGCLLAPRIGGDGQAVRIKVPVQRQVVSGVAAIGALVPVGPHLLQHAVQGVRAAHPGHLVTQPVAGFFLVVFGRGHGQAVVGQHQPGNGLGQRGVGQAHKRGLHVRIHAVALQAAPLPVQPGGIVFRRGVGQAGQPGGIVVGAHKGLEQPQRHPFVPVLVALRVAVGGGQLAAQPHLEGLAGFAQVVQQRGQGGQQVDVLAGVPVVLVVATQHVAGGGVGGHGPLGVEAAAVAHHPQQFAVVQPAYPVAGHCGVFAGALAQQAAQGVQAVAGDGGGPGALAPALGKLVEDAAGLGECFFVAL